MSLVVDTARAVWPKLRPLFYDWDGLRPWWIILLILLGTIAIALPLGIMMAEANRQKYERYMEVCQESGRTHAECETDWILSKRSQRRNTTIIPVIIPM